MFTVNSVVIRLSLISVSSSVWRSLKIVRTPLNVRRQILLNISVIDEGTNKKQFEHSQAGQRNNLKTVRTPLNIRRLILLNITVIDEGTNKK